MIDMANMGILLLIIGVLYVSAQRQENCHHKYPLIGIMKFKNYKLVEAKFLQTVKLDCHFW
jgi:hypothetical protein